MDRSDELTKLKKEMKGGSCFKVFLLDLISNADLCSNNL